MNLLTLVIENSVYLLVALLLGLVLYLFRDDLKLRSLIKRIEKEKQDLAKQLSITIEHQAAILDVLKFVMKGEIETARNSERQAIFVEALNQLKTIERDIIVNVTQSGGDLNRVGVGDNAEVSGPITAGRSNSQTDLKS